MKIRKMNNHNLAVEVERTASLDEFKWRVYSRIDGTCVQYSDRVWEPVLEWKPVTVNASSSGFSYKYGRCYLGEGGFIEVSHQRYLTVIPDR